MKGGLRPGLLPCEERVIDARRKTVSVLTAWAHTAEREKRKKRRSAGLLCWAAGGLDVHALSEGMEMGWPKRREGLARLGLSYFF